MHRGRCSDCISREELGRAAVDLRTLSCLQSCSCKARRSLLKNRRRQDPHFTPRAVPVSSCPKTTFVVRYTQGQVIVFEYEIDTRMLRITLSASLSLSSLPTRITGEEDIEDLEHPVEWAEREFLGPAGVQAGSLSFHSCCC
jgi:hypothetical protein